MHPIKTRAEIPAWHKERYHIASLYCEDKDVVDIACGVGYGSFILAERAKSVLGIDYDAPGIAFCSQYWSHPKVKYSVGDVMDLPDLPEYDCLVSCETIEHLPIPFSSTIKIFKKLIKRGGLLFLSYPDNEPNPPNLTGGENHFHTYIQNIDMVTAVHEGGFQVCHMIHQGNVPLMGIGYSQTIIIAQKR